MSEPSRFSGAGAVAPSLSRDNNLNLLRLLAAVTVLINHCFPLLGQPEPFGEILGMTLGTLAVDLFFVISGYLVYASLRRRQNALDYLCARICRLYPALILVTCLSVLVLGPLHSSLPLADYWRDPQTLEFLLSGTTLLAGIAMDLPGVFAERPFSAVNGSLWTLLYEAKLYLILLLLWALTEKWLVKLGGQRQLLAYLLVLMVLLAALQLVVQLYRGQEPGYLNRFIYLFFSGACYCQFGHLIRWRYRTAVLMLLVIALAGWLDIPYLKIAYCLSLPYLVLLLGLVPGGAVRRFNQLGDYSYGTYIFAFPIQQSIAAWWPQIAVWQLALSALLLTLLLAVASWHWLEQPALRRQAQLSNAIRRGWCRLCRIMRKRSD